MPRLVFLVLVSAILVSQAKAESAETATSAQNWCAQAEASLVDELGGAAKCSAVKKRCVLMNNYWCQKHGTTPWKGTPGADGKDGMRDVDGHAIFAAAEWSVRAIAIDIRTKYRRRLTSAIDIASQYSPWCDTLGSKAVVDGSGRSCRDGRAAPPPGFSGPICDAPKSANPSISDCKPGCNCPPSAAAKLIQDIGTDVNADLELFDKDGKPLANLSIFLRNLAAQEQGIYVRESVIAAGIAKLSQ
ncbi:hypothetical protein [Tahibacter sp.]|uniref:hypothetical protein n=1 Tax=Tahibacter sp. TaxID=2056211 RepID=UPI0028C3F5AB|nr:hypothetical protein [Tahibacter sp.]